MGICRHLIQEELCVIQLNTDLTKVYLHDMVHQNQNGMLSAYVCSYYQHVLYFDASTKSFVLPFSDTVSFRNTIVYGHIINTKYYYDIRLFRKADMGHAKAAYTKSRTFDYSCGTDHLESLLKGEHA